MISRTRAMIALAALLLVGLASRPVSPQNAPGPASVIETIAGGSIGDGGPAEQATVVGPGALAVAADGTLYIADERGHRVRKISGGVITTFAGGGCPPDGLGDGGPANQCALHSPAGLALAADGGVYIADWGSARVRKVTPRGVITTVAGYSGSTVVVDGVPATQSTLSAPRGLALGPDGSLYIAEVTGSRVRKVNRAGTITTVAGTGQRGFSGDGGPAVRATLNEPSAVALGADGSLYIADSHNKRVRKVSPQGIITTYAGGGTYGKDCGDNCPATQAYLGNPYALAIGRTGDLIICDEEQGCVRKVSADGTISTIVGHDSPSEGIRLTQPTGIAIAPNGSLYISDPRPARVCRASGGRLAGTVVGGGTVGPMGDGGPAPQARLYGPGSLALGPDGSLYIADVVVRRILPTGVITTVAGSTDLNAPDADGVPATQVGLATVVGLAAAPDGVLYVCERQRLRKVDREGIITTVAGRGTPPDELGDGGPATEAALHQASGVALGPDGSLYIADALDCRIRKVDPAGVISTFAGNGERGYSGDGGLATQATLSSPGALAVGPSGDVYIADYANCVVRKVAPTGTITTVVGDGRSGFSGDDGPATWARLRSVEGLAVAADGSVFIADSGNNRIRGVDPAGIITTVAGAGPDSSQWGCLAGDGGPAVQAVLYGPRSVVVSPKGTLFISDSRNYRIRRVRFLAPPPWAG